MKCPKCKQGETSVLETREVGSNIRRRRECQACGFRTTTVEMPIGDVSNIRIAVTGEGIRVVGLPLSASLQEGEKS